MNVEDDIPFVTDGEKKPLELYKHVRQRIAVHTASAIKRNRRYKRIAAFLHASIPLTSLGLTVIAGADFEYQHSVTAGVAVVLTALTGINYALQPGRRYAAYAEICIQLHDILFRMESDMEALRSDPKALLEMLGTANSDVSAVGRFMIDLPVPHEQLS